MRRALGSIILIASALRSAPAAASDLVLDPATGYIVTVDIKGVTLRLRVDPAASGLVILNPAAAARARLSPEIRPPNSFLPGSYPRLSYARIGPVNLTGRTSRAGALVAGLPADLRFIWFGRDAVEGADGIISVANLPFDRVVLRLAPQSSGETAVPLQLDFSPEMGLFYPYPLGDRIVPIQVSIWRQDNMSTAAAGALLASRHAGAWRGDYARLIVNFGIDRPVRPMALQRPIDLQGISVGQFLVRTGDYRGDYALPADAADPDEIVVIGASLHQAARLNLTLGRNQLARCSSITYQAAARRLTLSCAVNPRRAAAPASRPAPLGGSTPAGPAAQLPPR